MNKTFSGSQLESLISKLGTSDSEVQNPKSAVRNPVHVVYGGAHLFKSDSAQKLGKLALESIEIYAANFVEFAVAMWLKGADALPKYEDVIQELEFQIVNKPEEIKKENFDAWLAWTIYQRTIEKLQRESIEDFRIDFEDGYGIRSDEEEDAHSISASGELAKAFLEHTITPFCGFRIKSLAPETRRRAIRTLDLFLTNLLEKTDGKLPENFVVTLPKIVRREEVEILDEILGEFEKQNNLADGAVKIEIMIETPQAIINDAGAIALRSIVEAANGRCIAAHFGAYDYTASFGIAGVHQHLRHEACNFARQMMQIALAPMDIRLSDSVTIELPIPIYKNENLTTKQSIENERAVRNAWRKHFNNVTNSLVNGFYQSWDLHPAQLAARYAAVYAFFLESAESQGMRLKNFVEKAARANLTGNTFDDAASAQGLLNFFARASACGAMVESEILEASGLTIEELNSASFIKIMEARNKKLESKISEKISGKIRRAAKPIVAVV